MDLPSQDWAKTKIDSGFAGFDRDIKFCEKLHMQRLDPDTARTDALVHPPFSPVWTMITDKAVIKDHNDLLNEHFIRYVRQLYYLILREEDEYQQNLLKMH